MEWHKNLLQPIDRLLQGEQTAAQTSDPYGPYISSAYPSGRRVEMLSMPL